MRERHRLPGRTCPPRQDLWETESKTSYIINASILLCSLNKMPAVHHKLLLEDALQDSPQVGPCCFIFIFGGGGLVTSSCRRTWDTRLVGCKGRVLQTMTAPLSIYLSRCVVRCLRVLLSTT